MDRKTYTRNKLGCSRQEQIEVDIYKKKKKWNSIKEDAAEHFVHSLMLSHGIAEHSETFSSGMGEAYLEEKVIKIPWRINTSHRFLVTLHEIGHCKFDKRFYDWEYESEYDAEKFAITLAKLSGLVSEIELAKYVCSAKDYVRGFIHSAGGNGKLKIKWEIKEWLNDYI